MEAKRDPRGTERTEPMAVKRVTHPSVGFEFILKGKATKAGAELRATAGYSVSPASGSWYREQCVAGFDCVRMDHSGVASDRALHRAVEPRIDPGSRSRLGTGVRAVRSHQQLGDARRDMLLYAATRA
jgi:hypothetical protein